MAKKLVNASDSTTINDVLASYDNLSDEIKSQIDDSIIEKLRNQAAAATWATTHKDVIENSKVDDTDLDAIEAALESYQNLTDAQKQFVDPADKLNLDNQLAAAKWATANKDIIANKGPMASDDLDAVKKALNEYNALKNYEKNYVSQAVIDDLNDKLAVTEMLDENPILETDMDALTYEDLEALDTAVKAYDDLTEDQKDLVDDDTKVKIEAARDALNWLATNDSIISQDLVGNKDLDKINDALELYENLSDEAKGLIDQSIVDDLLAKKNAALWADKYDEIISKDPSTITSNDLDALRDAMDAYNKLSDEEKALIDTDVINGLIDAQKDAFIKKYLSDQDGNMYTALTAGNYEQILSGVPDWENMSQAEKDAINVVLKEKMGKTYEELIAQAKELQDSAKGFIDKYLTGKDGNIYKEATKDNYKQILSGLADWNKMSQDQKDAINALLVANGGKTYEELLKNAQAIEKELSVKTGDNTDLAGIFSLLTVSAAGLYLGLRKRDEIEA